MRGGTAPVRRLRCAIYTRKSSEEGLDMEFNSLDAQREACEAYIASQKAEGWVAVRERYDDGGFSGGTLERPGLQQLLADVEHGLVDVIVVYKIDRLSRSLMDFAKLVEDFDRNDVTFVSVTQAFNTTTSMGRLTLNISAFTVLIYYAITNLAALRLPREQRLFPAWIAMVGLAACLLLAFWVPVAIWGAGLALIAAGLVFKAFAPRLWRGSQVKA